MSDEKKFYLFTGTEKGLNANLKGTLKSEKDLNKILKGSISKKNIEKAGLVIDELLNKEIKVKIIELNPQKTGWILDFYNEVETVIDDTPKEESVKNTESSVMPPIKKPKSRIPLNSNNGVEKKKEISSFDMIDVPGNKNIKPFKMAKYVVVQKLYNEVMGKNPSHFVKNGDEDKMPVESVSFEDVILFCNELSKQKDLQVVYSLSDNGWVMNSEANGYRLPTEEEWHLAANEGKSKGDYPYSGSENIQKVAWWQGDNPKSTHSVGDDRKLPNKLGLYDMSGNVWEWCWDYDGNERICCGGAYNSSEEEITLTSIKNIKKVNPYAKDHTIGFRLVQTK